ncbi:MAG: aminotransferase class III-fold pyridoxal phosphate-dependent enzyme [Acidiferrobacterales bacterium]|nr:aminotransferase class III-fold pyridoxal phosphate-dependent enzyme [Acidiferrobacterales bacterium]
MNKPTVDVKKILQQDNHLVHSFANLNDLKDPDSRTVITRAEGPYVYDGAGNQYIDGIGGLWCVNVGHGRTEIADAVATQLKELDYYSTFYNLTHPLAAELSEKVTQMAPGNLNKVYFGNSGSVANDTAVRMLQHYFNRKGLPSKKRILSRVGAYHGSTYMAIAMTTPAYRDGWDSADHLVDFLSSPYPYRRPENMTVDEFSDFLIEEMVETIEKIGAENIAGFIAEPIMGAGGVIVPPEGYHRRAWEICQKYEIMSISDEVVTAFGRLGHMFASKDFFDIQPDIICSAKGLTSGYQPMSATIISDDIFDVISAPGGMFMHGMTYSGHPACCAAALANIRIIENEDICGHVRREGPKFELGLKTLETLDIVGEVRGSHFMMGIEFVKDKTSREPFEQESNIGSMVAQHAQRRGLIVRPLGSMAVLSPCLTLNAQQIDKVVSILQESIAAVSNEI